MARLTNHAQRRCQQRSITPMVIDFMEWFGCERYQTGGYSLLTLPSDPHERESMRRTAKQVMRLLDRDVFAIETDTGEVVTTGHQVRSIRSQG